MLSHNSNSPPVSAVQTKVFSLSSQRRWRLNGRYLLVFVALASLSLHLSSLMAKNEAKPVMWNPPVEPPGAVVVTRNSFETQAFQVRRPAPLQVAAVQDSRAEQMSDKALSPTTQPKADQQANEQALNLAAEEVRAALGQWSEAWRKQDMAEYLGAYAQEFVPVQGGSREAWAKQRTARIMAKQNIRHEVRDVKVQVSQNMAVVKFTQIYADERLQQTDQKTMHLVLTGGRWLIAKELAR